MNGGDRCHSNAIMRLQELNELSGDAAEAAFLRCCGSRRWARLMSAARPFAAPENVLACAERIARELAPEDWLEAFAAHPRLGDSGRLSSDSEREQSGMRTAADDVRRRLAAANRAYEARFGHIFIVCATGKTADEMLAILEGRLSNDPATELRVASEEQRKITRLRLERLLD